MGAGGHNALYVGGEPTALCGAVIIGDLNVVDGPTTTDSSDPNKCPHGGWGAEVHDPFISKQDGVFYLFGTGPGLPIWRSTDLHTWRPSGRVFADNVPAWAPSTVPGLNFPWAPDVSFFAGEWHVYYAISAFATKNSAIGVATNPTLDPRDPRYRWTDNGIVVQSGDTTDYNAIDPNVAFDKKGRPWLDFGSFWSGIKLAPIDLATGKLSRSTLQPLASRLVPTWGIEAPFVVRRGGYNYLFVSFDNCCRGSESTYNVRVGRSAKLGGPYVDDAGVPMLLGGGRVVLEASGDRRGPGHNAVLHDGRNWWLVFHYYDAADNGTAKLGILPIEWNAEGWPEVDWSDLRPANFVAQNETAAEAPRP